VLMGNRKVGGRVGVTQIGVAASAVSRSGIMYAEVKHIARRLVKVYTESPESKVD
jgi:hypothetical protein